MNAFLNALPLAATPIVLAALGGMFTHRAGVLNVALEGMMLVGAFAAISAGAAAHSVWVGLLASVGAALLAGALFGLGCLVIRADVFVVGIGVNLIAAGLTSFLLLPLFGQHGSYSPENFPDLPAIHLGALSKVPILGPLFDGQSVIVYATIVISALVYATIRWTRLGMYISIAGEAPEALEAVGIGTARMQWVSILLCSALCGLAGAQLSMAVLGSFTTNMTAGRGYIALAAVFFAAGRPLGTVFAGCLFGAAEALSNTLQINGFPSELILMLPYVLTIIALTSSRLLALESVRRWAAGQGRWIRWTGISGRPERVSAR
ncbi:MAG: ABC transporter permease [Solirubrobacterales bacterium]